MVKMPEQNPYWLDYISVDTAFYDEPKFLGHQQLFTYYACRREIRNKIGNVLPAHHLLESTH